MTSTMIAESKREIENEIRLKLYSYYKQATIGDCNTAQPSMIDFVGIAKWKEWNARKGMSKSRAMNLYINIALKADPSIQKKIAA